MDQGGADAGPGSTTETFRLRGGAGTASSGSDDGHSWYAPEGSPSMEPCSDHDDTSGTSHAMQIDEDPNDEAHSHEKQRHPGSYDDEDQQFVWRNLPNSRKLHRLFLSLAVTPSVSIEVESEFLVSESLTKAGVKSSSSFLKILGLVRVPPSRF